MKTELSGRIRGNVHVFPLRVYYEDTDASGLVYYADYLKFVERARTEMMRQLGLSHSELMAEHDAAFIVRRCDIDFRAPARLDDLLEVHTRILELSGASIDAEQIVKRDGADLARMVLKIACVNLEGRPLRLLSKIRNALAPFVQQRQPKSSL